MTMFISITPQIVDLSNKFEKVSLDFLTDKVLHIHMHKLTTSRWQIEKTTQQRSSNQNKKIHEVLKVLQ